ncbi:MAG: ATP-grasp domain-containing protein [bacterium]|nr:MAG: ATP-grasp domain-containing protein [bacterium]
MEDPLKERLRMDGEGSRFLYIGEIKAAGLNRFLVDPISRRYGQPASCIHIVPDILAHYPEGEFLVINREAARSTAADGGRINVRVPASSFAADVSRDERVLDLVRRILDRQGEVLINVFESKRELSLPDGKGVRLIGPDPALADFTNNKLNQYDMVSSLGIPLPAGGAFPDAGEAFRRVERILKAGKKAFVSGAYSAAGSNSIIAGTMDEVRAKFGHVSGGLVVTEFIEHDHDPTVLGIVASEGEVYIASVADQNIQGTKFTGSTFPTVLDSQKVASLVEMTRKIGSHLGRQGYRGAFGCDFIVDRKGRIYFIEINARKQGTTMETALTMELRLPGHPTFPELELAAVLEGRFPEDLEEMDSTRSPVFWGTCNLKVETDLFVQGYVPPSMDERDLFKGAVGGQPGYVVVDHVGPETSIRAGGFLARVIAAGTSREDVLAGLGEGEKAVRRSIGTGRSGGPFHDHIGGVGIEGPKKQGT